MKIIFLDVDGVMNSEESFRTNSARGLTGIDPYMAFLVGKLVMETDAQVVLSSSWRHPPESVEVIKKQVCKLLDMTTDKLGHIDGQNDLRGREIQAWLDEHPEVEKYAILDDSTDMLYEQFPNFFKTDWKVGITPEICEAVKKHLTT